MSSRFVSVGAINPTTGEVTAPAPVTSSSISPPTISETSVATSAVPSTSTTTTTTSSKPTTPALTTSNPDLPAPSKKSQEWLTVQAELEAKRLTSSSSTPQTIGGTPQEQQKSLYEVLQANKAAKQAAFEEANKIKNQFRALDDDEIEFLESVAERKRREEEERRKEEEGGLAKFREMQRRKGSRDQREGDEGGEDGEDGLGEEELMFLSGVGGNRKRRRGEERRKGLVPGVKRVKSQGEEGKKEEEEKQDTKTPGTEPEPQPAPATAPTDKAPTKKPLGGLVSYASSDEDDD